MAKIRGNKLFNHIIPSLQSDFKQSLFLYQTGFPTEVGFFFFARNPTNHQKFLSLRF